MKLKPYIQSEVLLARRAQQEQFLQLAQLRYERALILARQNPRQQAFVYYRLSGFWIKQKAFAQAWNTLKQANAHLFRPTPDPLKALKSGH
jgi:hypothetical protein